MTSKKSLPLFLSISALFVSVLAFAGCASMEAHQKESLLSAAGFHTVTPTTAKQVALFKSMEPYRVQRHVIKGNALYAYADKKANVVYLGDEKAYQRYKQLGLQQAIAEDQLMASEMNQDAALSWDSWGGWGMY